MLILPKSKRLQNNKYEIANSIELHAVSSQYFNKNIGTAGNQKTWTISMWVRRGTLAANGMLFNRYTSGSDTHWCYFNSTDNLYWQNYVSSNQLELKTSAVYRDTSSWYHIMFVLDTTEATNSNRAKIFVNGQQILSFITATYPALNADLKLNSAGIMGLLGGGGSYFDGVATEIYFIDGNALTPNDFGEFDENGLWVPKAYSGDYGANGFYLIDASGADQSSNANDWTPVNTPIDTFDTPTNVYGRFDAPGKNSNTIITLAATKIAASTTVYPCPIFVPVSEGKWSLELTVNSRDGTNGGPAIGFAQLDNFSNTVNMGGTLTGFWFIRYAGFNNGYYGNTNGTAFTPSNTPTAVNGDVIQLLVDIDAGKAWWKVNGTVMDDGTNPAGDPETGTYPTVSFTPGTEIIFVAGGATSGIGTINCGQSGFAYTPPSGFKALCTENLPAPVISDPAKHFDIELWTGNDVDRTIYTETAPGLVWLKCRSHTTNHGIFDVLRGAENYLSSNATTIETADSVSLTAFDSDGFSLGTDSGALTVNETGKTMTGWVWGGFTELDAGEIAALVSSTSATITPTGIAVNAVAGMAIITYTGNGVAGATLPNPIGIAPEMVIAKSRNAATDWTVQHISLTSAAYSIFLNGTAAQTSRPTDWNGTAATASIVTLGSGTPNTNSQIYVMYIFAPIHGFSAFGKYIGNGAADGPRVILPFNARWVMIKKSNAAENWIILDSERSPENLTDDVLYPNLSGVEYASPTTNADLLSNGFKVRGTNANINTSGGTYIYAAFAEHPFGGGDISPALAR